MLVCKPPLGVLHQHKRCSSCICRRTPKHTRSNLYILLANALNDVRCRQIVGGQFVRVEPYAHAEIARAKDLYVTDAREAAQLVLHLENGQVRRYNMS